MTFVSQKSFKIFSERITKIIFNGLHTVFFIVAVIIQNNKHYTIHYHITIEI